MEKSRKEKARRSAQGSNLVVDFLHAPTDQKVQDGDGIALIRRYGRPQALHLVRERVPMLPSQVVHALQQLFAPIPCARHT